MLQGPKSSSTLATTKGTLIQSHFRPHIPPRNSLPPVPSLPGIFFCGSLSNSEVGCHSPFLPPVLAGGKESLGGGGTTSMFVLLESPEGLESQVVTPNQS